MSGGAQPGKSSQPEKPSGDDASRRRRREQVFGDVLPETTGDEREQGAGEPERAGNDEWLRRNVPPHHG